MIKVTLTTIQYIMGGYISLVYFFFVNVFNVAVTVLTKHLDGILMIAVSWNATVLKGV